MGSEKNNCSWRNVPQRVRLVKVYGVRWLKRFASGAVLLLIIILVFKRIPYVRMVSCPQVFRKLVFQTNGVLSQNWLKRQIPLPLGKNLMQIDLKQIQQHLETYGQIDSAVVSRQFPDTLKIQLNELVPVAKMRVLVKGKAVWHLVSKEGKLFQAHCFKRSRVKPLPTLTYVSSTCLKSDQIVQFNKIQALITACYRYFPSLYAQITHISLKNFDPLLEEKWQRIEFYTQAHQHILLSCQNVETQMHTLKNVLQALSPQQRSQLTYIDLSLKHPVVRFKSK